MDNFNELLSHVDWIFLSVILIGGRYWGSKYFKISKNKDLNFLAFATLFGVMWLLIQRATGKIGKDDLGDLFLTYLLTTSFYQLLAKKIFGWIEKQIGIKDEDLPMPSNSGPGSNPKDPPPPPPGN